MLKLLSWKLAPLHISEIISEYIRNMLIPWQVHTYSSYTSIVFNTILVTKSAALQFYHLPWSVLRSLSFLYPSFSFRVMFFVGFGLFFFFCGKLWFVWWLEKKKKPKSTKRTKTPLMVSQKIAWVERPELKEGNWSWKVHETVSNTWHWRTP